jgi:hypothetical protein
VQVLPSHIRSVVHESYGALYKLPALARHDSRSDASLYTQNDRLGMPVTVSPHVIATNKSDRKHRAGQRARLRSADVTLTYGCLRCCKRSTGSSVNAETRVWYALAFSISVTAANNMALMLTMLRRASE